VLFQTNAHGSHLIKKVYAIPLNLRCISDKTLIGKSVKKNYLICANSTNNNGDYDVIVPCISGKDGCFTAHQLK
jgi:hypothetical protein